MGLTTIPPDRISLAYDYAAATRPSWFSSDSGSLWKNGRAYYDQGQWSTTRPINLKAGDVVTLTVRSTGALVFHCNGVWQVTWNAARVDLSKPLYALVGMRAPLCGVALRTRTLDLSHATLTPARSIVLKGIEGRSGETIDLTKHGRPKYPAAFTNERAISDVRSLHPLLMRPWAGRWHGRKGAQPILIRAGPGTGKTWCVMQLLYLLARGSHALSLDDKRSHIAQGIATRLGYLRRGCAQHAARLELTPFVVYVQKLARLMRQAQAHGALPTSDLVLFYARSECREGAFDEATLAMLEQLYSMRCLILLIDGVDEAADLKEYVEDHVTKELVPAGHPVVVTSRPEGVRLRLYKTFVLMNLRQLSDQQQQNAISMQLDDSSFYHHLSTFSAIRKVATCRAREPRRTSRFALAPMQPWLSSNVCPPRRRTTHSTRAKPSHCSTIATTSRAPSSPTSSRCRRAAGLTPRSATVTSTTSSCGVTMARHAPPSCERWVLWWSRSCRLRWGGTTCFRRCC